MTSQRKNSDVDSVLMHNQDLLETVRQHIVMDVKSGLKPKCPIEQTGNTEDTTSLEEKHIPATVVGPRALYSMVGMPSKPEKQPNQKLMNELDEESYPRYLDCDNSQHNSQMLENGKVPFEDLPRAFNTLGKMCRDLKTIPDSMHIEHCSGLTNEKHGGSASVSQGIYRGRKVAVKTLHFYATDDSDERFGVRLKILFGGTFA